jgi:uncharacterized protein
MVPNTAESEPDHLERAGPTATSQALARRRPDLVTFVPVAGAGHVRSWNLDRARYEQAAGAFLDRIGTTG